MKRILKPFYCILLTLTVLFSCAGCEFIKDKFFNTDEATAVKCAPCTVWEIWTWSEASYEEFFYLKHMSMYMKDGGVSCTVNGEDWPMIRRLGEDLEEGTYTIKFWTDEDFTVNVMVKENGENVSKEIPYQKDLTLTVKISSNYEDVCDYEYRQTNGLWTNAQEEEWYQTYSKKWEKECGR